MSIGTSNSTVGLIGLIVLATACEPESILEARDQISRGGERTIAYEVPLVDTVFKVEELLEDSDIDTTASGLLAIAVDPDTLPVGFGDELVFEGINLDTCVVSFTPAQLAGPPGTNIPFSVSYAALASDTILDDVDTVVVQSGVLWVTTQNRLPIPVTYTVTLNGFTGPGGGALVGSGTVPAAAGDGSYRSDVLTFDLASVTVVPATVTVDFVGSATVGGTPVPAGLGDSAIVQSGSIGTLQVESVAGTLDPNVTPELNVSIEEWEEIPYEDIGLGDLEEPAEESTFNNATIALSFANGADIQVELSDFNLGVVMLDASGNVPRDPFGVPVYEEDGAGNPILVPVVDTSGTNITLAALDTIDLDLAAAPLVDRLVHLLLDDERAAVIAAGAVAVGDSTQARVTSTDSVSVEMQITIAMDFTIPASGVSFTRNVVEDGLELDDEDIDEFIDRLDRAGVTADAENATPFAVELDIAFVEDSLGEDVDIFALPNRVLLSTIYLSAPTVDTNGVVVTPSSSIVTIDLTADETRQLLGLKFTAGVRARMLPGAGGNGRGAIRATDVVSLISRAGILVRSGGGGQ